ncbi:MAG: JAB domain-containing protein [Steroidobacteraceae bacterium]
MANGNDSVRTLYVRESNLFREATPEETLVAAHHAISRRFRRGATLNSPQLVREYLRITFATLDHEVFCVLLLDSHHRLLSFQEMFRGTIDSAAVFPREVVKEVLKHNAGAVIFAHNHPSGRAEPSVADESITRRLKEALALIDVRVLDHLVVAGTTFVSMAERGWI